VSVADLFSKFILSTVPSGIINHTAAIPFLTTYDKLFFALVDSVAGALRSAHDEICFG
jgi:hypothetical protein